MDFLQLRYFYDVAQTEHMTNSARRLHVAQPALSRTILKLEEELGCKLFERTGRRIKLSPSGEFLKQKAERILSEIDGIECGLEEFRRERNRCVTIDMEAALGTGLSAIAEYRKAFPESDFRLMQQPSEQKCDIVVSSYAPTDELPGRFRIADHAIEFDEDVCLAVPRKSSAFGEMVSEVASVDDVNALQLVALSSQHSFRRVCDQLCEANGLHPRIVFECECTDLIMMLVELGCGAAFVPEFSWIRFDRDLVRALLVACPQFKRRIRLELTDRSTASAESVRFFEFFASRVSRYFSDPAASVHPWDARSRAAKLDNPLDQITFAGF